MTKIVIADLHPSDAETFLELLAPVQTTTVLGGYGNVYISTLHDGINSVETNYEGAYGTHDNNYNSIDNSDQVYIWVYRC